MWKNYTLTTAGCPAGCPRLRNHWGEQRLAPLRTDSLGRFSWGPVPWSADPSGKHCFNRSGRVSGLGKTSWYEVRQNSDMQGIQVGNTTFKIKQYADDTQVFLLFEPLSIKEIFKVFEDFSTISELQINYTKMEVLRIGAIKNTAKTIETNEQLKWTNDCVDILGLTVSTKMNEMIRLYIDPLIEKIKNIIEMWSWRRLTLYGKDSIIKTLLSSQLIYRLSVLPTPQPDIMKSIDMTFITIYGMINHIKFLRLWSHCLMTRKELKW